MNDVWFEVLVIILSVMLALFLLLSIILVVKLIQISNHVKRITEYAEQTVEKAEEVAEFFKKTAAPVAIIKLITDAYEKYSEKSGKFSNKSKEKDE